MANENATSGFYYDSSGDIRNLTTGGITYSLEEATRLAGGRTPFSGFIIGGNGKITNIDQIGGGGGSSEVTKAYVDTQDKAVLDSIADDLKNYYGKEEVNKLIEDITTLDFKVVEALPTEEISTSTIYLVPKDTEEEDNVYSEYLYVNSKWELIGDTVVDLSGYAKSEELAEVAKSGSYEDLEDKPTSLPANGGNADTVDGKHASDFAKANLPTSIPVPLNISEASSKWYRLFCFNPIAGGVVNFSLAGGHPFNAGGSFVVTASWDKFNVKAISFSSNFESLRVKAVRCGYSIAGDNLHYIDVKLEVAEALVSSSVLFLTIGNDSNVSNKNIDLSGLGSDVDSVTYTSNYVKTITNNTEDVAVVFDSWEGYAKLSNGLYMEWGNEYLGNEGSLIDISFHNAFVAVPVVMISTDSVSNSFPCVSMSSKTGFKMQKTVEPTIAFWLAVGKL